MCITNTRRVLWKKKNYDETCWVFSTVLPSTASQPNASLTVSFAQQVAVHCKVFMRGKVPHQVAAFSTVTPSIKFAGTHLYTSMERDTVRVVSCPRTKCHVPRQVSKPDCSIQSLWLNVGQKVLCMFMHNWCINANSAQHSRVQD